MRSHSPPKPRALAAPPAGDAAHEYEARRAAFIEEEVDRALTMYRGLFPPDVLEAFRERTAVFLMTDPQMIRAIDAALPRPAADQSEVVAAGAPSSDPTGEDGE